MGNGRFDEVKNEFEEIFEDYYDTEKRLEDLANQKKEMKKRVAGLLGLESSQTTTLLDSLIKRKKGEASKLDKNSELYDIYNNFD